MIKLINISNKNHIVNHYMAQLRNYSLQNNRNIFCENIKRLGFILGVEAANYLHYSNKNIKTPFGTAELDVLSVNPVLCAIVRAGIKLQEGVSAVFPDAECIFCTCPKTENGTRNAHLFNPINNYGNPIIISDPIMTSASSMIATIDEINKFAEPSLIIILNLISTALSLKNLEDNLTKDAIVITCAVDEYVKGVRGTIPGLGDAGDLIYGKYQ